MAHLYIVLYSLLALAGLQGICAVQYEVINNTPTTPGGIRFDHEIGIPFTKQIMGPINKFIWDLFQQQTPNDQKYVESVRVVIEDYRGVEGFVNGDIINISAPFLSEVPGNIKWEFTSLLYHEMTHVFQWSGDYTAPGGLTEGIADYTMLKANYYHPETFAKPGQGNKWDEGYEITARFLEYCNGLRQGFVAALNKKMRYAYSDNYFVELLGKPVDQLWSEYKAKYNN